jgi:hypothetical protein
MYQLESKKSLVVLFVCLALCASVFIGCPANPTLLTKGTLDLRWTTFDSSSAEELLSATSFTVTLTDSAGNVSSYKTSDPSASITGLEPGTYSVKVIAVNTKGVSIGEASTTAAIAATVTTSKKMAIKEYQGNGTLCLATTWETMPSGSNISVIVKQGDEVKVASTVLETNGAEKTFTLQNGTYTLVYVPSVNSGFQQISQTVRVVKGQTTKVTKSFTYPKGTLELSWTTFDVSSAEEMLTPSSYTVTLTDSAGKESVSTTTNKTISIPDLKPGTWKVNVVAINAKGVSVGDASLSSVTITGDQKTTKALAIAEYQGEGTLSVTATWNDMPSGENISVIVKQGDEVKVEKTALTSSGTAQTFTLSNGIYTVSFEPSAGSGFQSTSVSVRIVKGMTTKVEKSFSTTLGTISVTINDTIVQVPSFTLSSVSATYASTDSLSVSATGIPSGYAISWYLDATKLENTTSSLQNQSLASLEAGKHAVTCVITKGDIIWSETKSFMVE